MELMALGVFVSGCTTARQAGANRASSWELAWDDTIDGSLDHPAKVCHLRLAIQNGKATGNFDGLVLGLPREARFSGKLIRSGSTTLLVMEQREQGYTCVYQMQSLGAGYFGVWHDTRGAKGDVELHQASSSATAMTSP